MNTIKIPKNGNVQAVKTRNEMKNLGTIYLLHFLYLPIVLIYAIYLGEDIGTIGLYLVLTFIVCLAQYLFNFIVTKISSKYIQNKIFPFLIPVFLLLLLKVPINWLLKELDVGGVNGYLYIVTGTFIINVISYFLIGEKDVNQE